jgi:three-Cys-motif partner protein
MARDKGTRIAKDGQIARVGGVWTADKLYYLERYAAAFTVAMRKKWDALVYIDLLAGPGKDIEKQSGREFDGSPLIALRTEPKFDRVILGDLDPRNVRRCEPESPRRTSLGSSWKLRTAMSARARR